MRVTNNMMLRNTTSNINNNKYSVNSLNNQMSSQKKISRPSEDPVVAIRALRLRSNLSEINQYYEKNIPDADAWLNVTETALENMKTILSDIRTQCTYGASDQLKAEDRKTILTQLESLRKQIYSEGNSDHAGRTVFTGYRTNCKLTFMEDESNTEYNIQQKFSYEDIGEHRYYDGQVELKTAEEMSQKVTTSDTKQYTYDRIRLAYGNIGSLKDKDGNEIAVGNTGTLSYHYTDNTGAAKTGDLNVTVYETEDDWKKAVKAGNMPEDVTEDIFVSKIVYNYSGTLPAKASIRLNVGKAYAGQTLYYSQLLDDGTIISMMSAIVDNDGYMTVEQDHCSTYLITRQQLTGNSTENVTGAADNKVETPQTGDNSNIVIWLTLCIILCCGITLYIFAVKARKMNR